MRPARPYTYLATVQGTCRQCGAFVPSRVFEEKGAVFQERLCPRCGPARARLADRVEWYLDRMATTVRCRPSLLPGLPVKAGCPRDCGPCAAHANACHLPVFSVTNVCNMACPICFTYNRSDRKYFMGRTELRLLLDRLIARVGPLDLLNITGGEPTLHPDILSLLQECKRPEIGRITMNSNGLRLASDDDFCRALAELGIYVVLSFHTFQPDRAQKIHARDVVAQKQRALENLQRFGIGTTLLNVMIRGLNDDEIGGIIQLAKTHSAVRSVTVQTMTFTGHGGRNFQPRETMPLDGAAAAIERGTNGEMRESDFFAHAAAHPLCYSVAYYLNDGGRYRSLTDLLNLDELRSLLAHGYLLQPDERGQDLFRVAIDRLWAEGDENLLPALRALVDRMYPPGRSLSRTERQAAAEQSLLAIYLHSHMDEDTLDLARLAVCPDQVPDPEGRLIPACAYNLFYRQMDLRFWHGLGAPSPGAPASLPAGTEANELPRPSAIPRKPPQSPSLGAPASVPALPISRSGPPTTKEAACTKTSKDAGGPNAFLTPSFAPANKETSRPMTQVQSPEPHLGWHSRRYLPHWDHPGMIQSLTFRLHDSMPAELINKWRLELGLSLRGPRPGAPASLPALLAPPAPSPAHPLPASEAPHARDAARTRAGKDAGAPGGDPSDYSSRSHKIELLRRVAKYEDEGHGACWLRDARIANLVQNALLKFDNERYRLLAWCIMPNHVHVMIETIEGFPLDGILHSWKSFTATKSNKLLGRKGKFWQREYRDRFIRHAQHYADAVRYIEGNPVKARLVKLAVDWPFSSARFKAALRTPAALPLGAPGAPASLPARLGAPASVPRLRSPSPHHGRSPANALDEKQAGRDAGAPSSEGRAGKDAGAPGSASPGP